MISRKYRSTTLNRLSLALGCATVLFVAPALMGCGSFRAAVPPLNASTIPTRQLGGTVVAVVDGVTDAERCSESAQVYDFCLTGIQSALKNGLDHTLEGFGLAAGGTGYRATLRVDDFTHGLENESVATMSVNWQFVLLDPNGAVVVQLAERTSSPQPISGRGDLEPAARRMFDAVLDRIANTLNAASAPTTATPVTATVSAPPATN